MGLIIGVWIGIIVILGILIKGLVSIVLGTDPTMESKPIGVKIYLVSSIIITIIFFFVYLFR